MNTIKCHKCGADIEIDKALEERIESRVAAQIEERHKQELVKIKSDAEAAAKERMDALMAAELEKRGRDRELEYEKQKILWESKAERQSQKQELLIEKLTSEAEYNRKANEELREELKKMSLSMREKDKAIENADLEAAKKLSSEAARIREEVKKEADESHRLKESELQKQLSDTKKALDEAQRKAEQGSQQNQGEVMELELEYMLRREFPADVIEEVKKGQRGADIKQFVKNGRLDDCGILLWESKNAKWSGDWIAKIKNDVLGAGANVGIIVSRELPDDFGEMFSIESGVWAVKPKLALPLASALRGALLQVSAAARSLESKDDKKERMYQYLTGVEFANRIRAIVDNYTLLQEEIEREKRACALRWGKQEKAIRSVIDNTYGFFGDIQGLIGNKLQETLLIGGEQHD
jgi:hypothetical protein